MPNISVITQTTGTQTTAQRDVRLKAQRKIRICYTYLKRKTAKMTAFCVLTGSIFGCLQVSNKLLQARDVDIASSKKVCFQLYSIVVSVCFFLLGALAYNEFNQKSKFIKYYLKKNFPKIICSYDDLPVIIMAIVNNTNCPVSGKKIIDIEDKVVCDDKIFSYQALVKHYQENPLKPLADGSSVLDIDLSDASKITDSSIFRIDA